MLSNEPVEENPLSPEGRGGGESADGSKLGVPQSIAVLLVAALASNESLIGAAMSVVCAAGPYGVSVLVSLASNSICLDPLCSL